MKEKTIFALGFFDGVHMGHQALLTACRTLAEQLGMETAAITFDRHPQSLFSSDPPPLINSAYDRQGLLRSYGMDHIYQYPVTKEVMSTGWQRFLEDLQELGAAGFVCGDDFRFGNRGEGDGKKLEGFCRERGLTCVIVGSQSLDGIRVSSTHIRSLLESGEMETAVRFLGHPHILTGRVVHGHKLGRKLGFPTANLTLRSDLVVPRFGVYACRALVDGKRFPAVTNVGIRPTVSGTGITVEPWILDYTGDLYDREITLEFYKFLRPEKKFPDLETLRQEIYRNADETRAFFKTLP